MQDQDDRLEQAAPATPSAGQLLRQQAEEITRNNAAQASENIATMSLDETRRLFHELRVHQVELELQNEELRRAQLELQTSRAEYFDLYDLAPVGHVTLSEQGLILKANLTAATLLGMPRGQLVKQLLSRFIVPEDEDTYYRHRRQLLATAQPQVCELRMARHDATWFWARLEATVRQDGECQTPVCRVTLSDITARKRAEEHVRWDGAVTSALAILHKPLISPAASLVAMAQAVLEQALLLSGSEHGFVSIVDPATGEHVAHTFTEMLPEGHQGNRPIVMPRSSDGTYRGLWGAALNTRQGFFTNSPPEHPAALGVPPGHVPLRQLLAVPVLLGDELVGQIALANPGREYTDEDVGAVRRLAESYALGIQRQRTEEQLHLAQAAAETASRLKSEFLANMSHEIRTPMTAILGFSDLLADTELTHTEQAEFVESIQNNGNALLRLINDILDLSRIEADRLVIEKTPCQLQRIIEDVLEVVKLRAAGKGIGLQRVCRLPLPETIHTDPARLRQVLVNLLGNAVKFTEQGEVHLTIQALAEGSRLQFAVTDTGIGIPADKLGKLFQPFMQVDGSNTRRYGGTGLGLAISQRLAKALGGEIVVTSEIGRGSTFSLTIDTGLPEGVCLPPALPELSYARESLPAVQPARELQGRVLLAEDSPDNQMVIRHLLKKRKLDVDLAEDGQVACELAERSQAEGKPYALILMDMQMPRLNGFEATQRLRQQGWRGPIVAVTAYAMAGDRERCLQAGCNDYLAKPITMNEFQKILQRCLS
ncbi:MAG: ATP-binding protein [Planctomycetota bacterium]|nr:ATP-binding protein [Planctomycetota bacterium]